MIPKRIKNAAAACALAAAVTLSLTSCLSTDLIARAEGRTSTFSSDPEVPREPNPLYFALVPLTIPIDLITLPIQYFYYRGQDY